MVDFRNRVINIALLVLAFTGIIFAAPKRGRAPCRACDCGTEARRCVKDCNTGRICVMACEHGCLAKNGKLPKFCPKRLAG